jgi:hypothetical protein
MEMWSVNARLADHGLNSFAVKLLSLPGSSCWILSMQASVDVRPPSHPAGRFDPSAVNFRLADESELSDKALSFKKLFETFQTSRPPDMDLMSSAAAAGLSGLPAMAGLAGVMSLRGALPPPVTATASCPENDLSRQLSALEKRLSDKIDQVAKEQNDKLDRILGLLERCQSQ